MERNVNQPNPVLSLVGNFLPEEVKGQEFPESPSLNFQCLIDVKGNACLATKGKGRLFVPIALLSKLSSGVCKSKELHVIEAAPGLPPIPRTVSYAGNRCDYVKDEISFYKWYWKSLIEAMKPVNDYIPETDKFKLFSGTNFLIYPTWADIFHFCQEEINVDLIFRLSLTAEVEDEVGATLATPSDVEETKKYLKSFQTYRQSEKEKALVFILDNHIDLDDLEEEERVKYRGSQMMNPAGNQPSHQIGQMGSSHGTRIFKFVAATSTPSTEIHFMKVGNEDNIISFDRVALALEQIIGSTSNEQIVLINCSFTLPPLQDPSVLTEPGLFKDVHEIIHKMGFIIFGAAGNAGFKTPHHPWGGCEECIVVGATDNVTDKIAAFSSGCCCPSIDVLTRGTNFADLTSPNQFRGTSFSTAILSGAFSFIFPHIWTIDDWRTVHDVVKKFIASTSDNKFGCGPDTHPHSPIQWKKFNFQTAILALSVETLGAWCAEAINFIDILGNLIPERTNEPKSKIYLKQRISVTIQRSNAASVMGILGDNYKGLDEIFYILKNTRH